MAQITIREVDQIENGFTADLILEGRGNYPITITNPFSDQEEKLLEWYFEGWLNQPHLDRVIAERAKASVKTYGEALFEQVFQSDIDAYSEYKQWAKDLTFFRQKSPDLSAGRGV